MADDIQKAGANLFWYPVGFNDAVTLEMSGRYGIFIDGSKFCETKKLKSTIAHEIGHCATGCTHKVCSPLDLIERHEYRANRWMIERYLPFDAMNEAMRHGYVEVWALAEYFDVPEEDIVKAVRYYTVFCGKNFE